MSIDFHRVLKNLYPDYDETRQRYRTGDAIWLPCGAVVICKESAVLYFDCWVIRRSLIYRNFGLQRIWYKDVPRELQPSDCKLLPSKKLKWAVGDIVRDQEFGMLLYLHEEYHAQQFYGWVLEADDKYYLHTSVCVSSPIVDYVS